VRGKTEMRREQKLDLGPRHALADSVLTLSSDGYIHARFS